MLCFALTALWAWGVMFLATVAGATAEVQQTAALSVNTDSPILSEQLLKRQSNGATDGFCKAFGVDFQDGGSYFLDQKSGEDFRAGTRFEGCQPSSTADVLLVDRLTSKQYNCGTVPTTPDDVPQVATCQVKERDMRSGNWSLLILGDNALEGKPFAYERDFALTVAPQQTVTVSKTCIYTFTERPTNTISSTYTHPLTSTLANPLVLTSPAATNIVTVTPKPSTVVGTTTTTRTFTTWTRTEKRDTVVMTPTCKVPPKAMLPDGMCKIVPTIVPVPKGLDITGTGAQQNAKIADRAVDVSTMRKRFDNNRATSIAPPPPPEGAAPAGARQTLTLTAPTPLNLTTTTTLPIKTLVANSTTTHTLYVTAAPRTVFLGTAMSTVYALASTETRLSRAWTRVYEVQTMSVGWTWTSTVAAGAEETGRCRGRAGWLGV